MSTATQQHVSATVAHHERAGHLDAAIAATTERRAKLVQRAGDLLGVEPNKVCGLLRNVWSTSKGQPPLTDQEMFSGLSMIARYGLDPIAREVYVTRNGKGQLMTIIGIDGVIKILDRTEHYDGFEQTCEFDTKTNQLLWCETRIYSKTRTHPTAYAKTIVAALRDDLGKAEQNVITYKAACDVAAGILEGDEQHTVDLAQWKETIADMSDVAHVSANQINEASKNVEKAREAVEAGIKIRTTRKAIDEADTIQREATAKAAFAVQMRDAAHGTNDVLASVVLSGELVPTTDDDGNFRFAVKSENDSDRKTYYHDLGPGRRTAIAVIEAASCLEELAAHDFGLVVLPQHLWEGLDWKNRALVDSHVRELGVSLITAEADKDTGNSGGIRAEVFEQ